MNRAYSLITVKAVDEDKRILSGIATTPSTDHQGDIVEPKGAEFSLPIPFLWQHNASQPIGHVTKAKVSKDGIEVEIKLAKSDEPGTLKERLDEAWQSIRAGLVRGLSIGFKALEFSSMDDGGIRFIKWSWLELSAVTIPANGEATITAIKAADVTRLTVPDVRHVEIQPGSTISIPCKSGGAATGRDTGVVRLTPPGASGLQPNKSPKETEVSRTVQEQITDWSNTRATKSARMEAIMNGAAEKGETLDAAQETEYDDLSAEVGRIDKHLARLNDMAKVAASKAVQAVGDSPETASASRGGARIEVLTPKLEKGIGFARFAMCMGAAQGNPVIAREIAKEHYPEYVPLHNILRLPMAKGGVQLDTVRRLDMQRKTAVAGGSTSHSDHHSALVNYQDLAGEFVEFLRPRTIIGQFGLGNIPSLRRVPFNIRVPRQTTKAGGYWTGEGLPKLLTSFNTEQITLDFFKAATICVLTDELVRFSNPSAEALVRDELARAVIETIDIAFIDSSNSGSAAVKPAAITNGTGVVSITSAGDTADNVRTDVKAAMAEFIQANMPLSSGVWVMNENVALALSMMMNDLGQPEFPSVTPKGGTFVGLPVLTSQYVPTALVALMAADQIYLADDGNVSIATSSEASLEMVDTSSVSALSGTGASLVSMFQTNSIAIRAEREINWMRRRPEAVTLITSANWGGTAGSGDI